MQIIFNYSGNSPYLTEHISYLECVLESNTNTHSDKNKSNTHSPTTHLQLLFNVVFIIHRNIICAYNV